MPGDDTVESDDGDGASEGLDGDATGNGGDGDVTDGGADGDVTADSGDSDDAGRADSDSAFWALLERLDSYPLLGGIVSGISSFIGGFALLFGLLAALGNVDYSQGATEVVRSLGYVFYNSFNVPTYQRRNLTREVVYRAENGTEVGEGTLVRVTEQWQNSITGTRTVEQRQYVDGQLAGNASQSTTFDPGLAVPELVYLALPVVALVAVGYVYGDQLFSVGVFDPNTISVQGLVGGIAMMFGYLLVALVGTYLLVKTGSGGQSVLYPARFDALVLGAAYPLVAGTVGVVVGQLSTDHVDAIRDSEEEEDGEPDGQKTGGDDAGGDETVGESADTET